MVGAEAEHAKGEEGARLTKKILESTTLVQLPYVVYDTPALTVVPQMGGVFKTYDLVGHFLGDDIRPLNVEVKNYNVVGRQPSEYKEFLANAFSATMLDVARRTEFAWVTWHPFDLVKWSKLTSASTIRQAVEGKLAENPNFLAGESVSDEVLHALASRLWLIPMHRRQEDMLMTREELMRVHALLLRKGMP